MPIHEDQVDTTLTFLTVVFSDEIALLRLQARSMAKFASDLDIDKILICVNDVDSETVRDAILKIIPEYGDLAPRVHIVFGDELFSTDVSAHPLYRFRRWLAWINPIRFVRPRGGWRFHNGWKMQQAFKLACCSLISSRVTVILDAKNVFLRPLAYSDFVAECGRPRATFMLPEMFHKIWYPPSAGALGLPRDMPTTELTNYMTPYPVKTEILSNVVHALSDRKWPVEALFAKIKNDATEFMLINAHCNHHGGLRKNFTDGMFRSYTIFSGMDAELSEQILSEASTNDAKCIGIHRTFFQAMDSDQDKTVMSLLAGAGLLDGAVSGRGVAQENDR